jgi:hypothetical protein
MKRKDIIYIMLISASLSAICFFNNDGFQNTLLNCLGGFLAGISMGCVYELIAGDL